MKTLISGGQAGVDRAALDSARRFGLDCGGYCPKERWAEDGRISVHYPMIEVDGGPEMRTRANVEAAHATVVIHPGIESPGTRLTLDYARELDKPLLELDLGNINHKTAFEQLTDFLARGFDTVNVAGPRASEWGEGYAVTRRLLDPLVREYAGGS